MTFPFVFCWPVISHMAMACCLEYIAFILGVCSIKNSTTVPFGQNLYSYAVLKFYMVKLHLNSSARNTNDFVSCSHVWTSILIRWRKL